MTPALRWALIGTLTIGALALMGRATSILLLAFAAILIATFFEGCAARISGFVHISYGWSLALFLLALCIGLLAVGWLFAARISGQMDTLSQEIPRAVEQLRERASRYEWIRRAIAELPTPQQLAASGVLQQITGVFSSVLGAITGGGIVLLMAVFLAADRRLYQRGLLRLVPVNQRPRALNTMNAVGDTLWQWMLAKLGSMLTVGVLTYIGLLIVGLPLAFTLALIAGLLGFIPNFGAILAAVPAVLLGLSENPPKAMQVGLVLVIVQIIEGNLVTPLLERKTVRLPPALTIAVQVLLGMLAGGLGVLVASPLLAASIVVVEHLYVEDRLGDDLTESTLPVSVRNGFG
jgi:predicted PurR-regulated permease PerM